MPKEILLYSSIYSYSAAAFINELEANKDKDIVVRGNCPGGDMFSTFGMVAKFNEHPKGKKIKVDGIAASAFAYMCLTADEVECLDASSFLFHRAACGNLAYEAEMSEDEKKVLAGINGQMRSALEKKCTSEQFQTITGSSYDQLFDMSQRKDVILNANQAKALGIVTKITPLTVKYKAEVESLATEYKIAAFASEPVIAVIPNPIENKNPKKMTAAEFKAAHPEAYNEIFNAGVSAEKTRVNAWLAWDGVDAKAVKEGINGGKAVDMEVISAMSVKAVTKAGLAKAESENAEAITTEQAPTTETPEADKAFEANKADLFKALGLTEKKK